MERETDEIRGTDGSRNMRYRLRKRNQGATLTELYENALRLELTHPFVLAGLDSLLQNS